MAKVQAATAKDLKQIRKMLQSKINELMVEAGKTVVDMAGNEEKLPDMNDRASQQLSHFIIRCPGIAVTGCLINDDFPPLTAGIRTKRPGTDKRIHIVRFTQFQ